MVSPHLNTSTPATAMTQRRGSTRVATNTHTSGDGALCCREGSEEEVSHTTQLATAGYGRRGLPQQVMAGVACHSRLWQAWLATAGYGLLQQVMACYSRLWLATAGYGRCGLLQQVMAGVACYSRLWLATAGYGLLQQVMAGVACYSSIGK